MAAGDLYGQYESPKCQGCGGALMHEAETCLCGGRSQFWAPLDPLKYSTARRLTAAEALEQLEARRFVPGSWEWAMDGLRRRYVPPE